jgi:flagella basal body P-ring formation protein FlgA
MISALLAFAAAVGAPCLHPSGPKISAADVAVSVPAFAALSPELVLGYSPQPGFSRVFTPGELMQWLSRHDVKSALTEPVCFAWDLRKPEPDKIRAAMLASLPEGSDVTVLETSQFGIPEGELTFPLSGLQSRRRDEPSLWRGHVRYAGESKYDLWARTDVRIPFARVVAAEDIKAGTKIEPSMVRLDSGKGPPVSQETLANLDTVVGRIARRFIQDGVPVAESALEKAWTVNKGDNVHVTVRSGATRILFDGVAGAPAVQGQAVPVRMADTGKLVRAHVVSAGQVILDLGPKEK